MEAVQRCQCEVCVTQERVKSHWTGYFANVAAN